VVKYAKPDYKYYERLVKAEEEAQENKRGIWGIKQ
jgi:endonuclease YncB( thermonuclease family)